MSTIKQFILAITLITLSPLSQAEVLLKDSSGHHTSFSTLKGKWVLINYWAGWCQTCIEEIPELNRFYHSHKNDPVALYAVNYDALPNAEQKALIKRLNIRYPSLLQDPGEQLKLGDIRGVPVTFVFNPQGNLVKTLYGGQDMASLNKVIAN